MRQIKFRAWDKKKELMITQSHRTNAEVLAEAARKGWEVMQSTNLTDKNGKEIYEGDLLKDPKGQIGKVFYSDKSASYLVNWKMKDGSYETDSCLGYGEVIGNVHENKELLT